MAAIETHLLGFDDFESVRDRERDTLSVRAERQRRVTQIEHMYTHHTLKHHTIIESSDELEIPPTHPLFFSFSLPLCAKNERNLRFTLTRITIYTNAHIHRTKHFIYHSI